MFTAQRYDSVTHNNGYFGQVMTFNTKKISIQLWYSDLKIEKNLVFYF